MDLSITYEHVSDEMTVVTTVGECDVYTAPKLREVLIELVNHGRSHLIIDMNGVDYLDSTGLGVITGGLKRCRAHDGSVGLVCTEERLLKIFRITGLVKVFPIFSSVAAAEEGLPRVVEELARRRAAALRPAPEAAGSARG
ncbi:anti-sigma B factor antagonist [Streptomyces sp. SAJ15]|nr:anti-sigma B factor antagonist [Streptomyces sp. SAJ15]